MQPVDLHRLFMPGRVGKRHPVCTFLSPLSCVVTWRKYGPAKEPHVVTHCLLRTDKITQYRISNLIKR